MGREVLLVWKAVKQQLKALEPEMVQTLCGLVGIPAVSPADGGTGEGAKAA